MKSNIKENFGNLEVKKMKKIAAVEEFYDSGSESGSSDFEDLFGKEEKILDGLNNINNEENKKIENNFAQNFDFSIMWFKKITHREIKKTYMCSTGNIIIPETHKEPSNSVKTSSKNKKNDDFLIETTDKNLNILFGENKKFADKFLENLKKVVHLE